MPPISLAARHAAGSTSTSDCVEAHAFRTQCASAIAGYDEALAQARYRHALIIEWEPSKRLGVYAGTWGVGHMLTLAYRLHAMCFRLRRYCYLQLFDSAYEDYFTYANEERWSWKASDVEMQNYPGARRNWHEVRRVVHLNCSLEQRWSTRFLDDVVYPTLEADRRTP